MSQDSTKNTGSMRSYPRFAAMYERMSRGSEEQRFMEPLRQKILARAHGLVLEVGAGNGLNFPLYDPAQVERVEAIEPDPAMLRYARERVKAARVPITLTQGSVETLPFANATFDCAVATLVFCSVPNPLQGLREIRRVLKPGGSLLMVEHVRSHRAFLGGVQDILVPLTTRMCGNCHWNRDTLSTVHGAGFQISYKRDYGGFLMPVLLLEAANSPST